MEQKATTYGARWILPISRPPLENAAIVVANGTIQEIVSGGRSSATVDLGEVAMLPQLINAHTHLEFSSLERPIGDPGVPITDWIPQVIAWRLQNSPETSEHVNLTTRQQSVSQGIEECLAFDTAAIGEIATSPWFHDMDRSEPCHIAGFIERLGHDPSQISDRISEAEQWLDKVAPSLSEGQSFFPGLSPHAPYSMHDDLFKQIIDLAALRNLPVAMHLAESEQEIQWLKHGDGPFANMLTSLGIAWEKSRHRRPMDYMRQLSMTRSSLIVHGNYLSDDELDFAARHSDRMHLVYCPRTHEFFGHKPWPMNEVLRRGINVALGTDSRASNPDLDLWQELKTVMRRHPKIAPATILHQGTLGGAWALGLDHCLGSLDPGKEALWKTIRVEQCHKNDIERLVLESH